MPLPAEQKKTSKNTATLMVPNACGKEIAPSNLSTSARKKGKQLHQYADSIRREQREGAVTHTLGLPAQALKEKQKENLPLLSKHPNKKPHTIRCHSARSHKTRTEHRCTTHTTHCLETETSSLRSTCGGRLRDQTRRTPPWRSTSAGRWRGKQGWNHRSRQSTCAREERQS